MTATQTEFTPAIPTISFTTGTAYDVLPDDGQPLRYFRTAYSRLEQHSNYTGDYRPNYVVVSRVERNGVATCNVNVTFRDPRGVVVDTWVHHSFLVPVGAAVGEVTIEQKVAALSEHMHQSIGTEDWPDAGDPGDWATRTGPSGTRSATAPSWSGARTSRTAPSRLVTSGARPLAVATSRTTTPPRSSSTTGSVTSASASTASSPRWCRWLARIWPLRPWTRTSPAR